MQLSRYPLQPGTQRIPRERPDCASAARLTLLHLALSRLFPSPSEAYRTAILSAFFRLAVSFFKRRERCGGSHLNGINNSLRHGNAGCRNQRYALKDYFIDVTSTDGLRRGTASALCVNGKKQQRRGHELSTDVNQPTTQHTLVDWRRCICSAPIPPRRRPLQGSRFKSRRGHFQGSRFKSRRGL